MGGAGEEEVRREGRGGKSVQGKGRGMGVRRKSTSMLMVYISVNTLDTHSAHRHM